jgi:Fe-S-cluster containining protein
MSQLRSHQDLSSSLSDFAQLHADDRLDFRCGRELDCFTSCCRDVSILLTPYDVLRMKKALHLDSSEFLERYAVLFLTENKLPIVLLRMNDEDKRCSLVTPEGCSIYPHRPWACRMYPLGVARPDDPRPEEPGFYFLIREELCHGHGKGNGCTVREWVHQEDIEAYEMMAESFQQLMSDRFRPGHAPLSAQQAEMYLMVCYDLDRFRRFVFETSFLTKFKVDEDRVEAIRTDDVELLEFGLSWLRFCLFGERTMKIRGTPAAAGFVPAQGAVQPKNPEGGLR